MTKCSIPSCNRHADADIMFRGHEVCKYHEKLHWNSKGSYIWLKLGLEPSPKETQVTLL
jgi:hypothetical protein